MAVAAAVAVGMVGGAATLGGDVASATADVHQQRAQSSLYIGGCVIRIDPGGPRIHANSSHTCVGVKSVRITQMGRLQIMFTSKGRNVALTANADETLTARGVQVGVNGTSTYASVTLYDGRLKRKLNLRRSADYRRAAGSTSNVWFSSVRVRS